MYTEKSLISEVLAAEVAILRCAAIEAGRSDYDPYTSCSGIAWAAKLVYENPDLTVADLEIAFVKTTDPCRGSWISGLLGNQWRNLPDKFRKSMMKEIRGDEALWVAKKARSLLSPSDKAELRKSFILLRASAVSEFDAEASS
jgi:hypothetical protein